MKIFIFLVLLLLIVLFFTYVNNVIKLYKEPIELNFKKWVLSNSAHPNWYKVVKNGYSMKMTNTGITLPSNSFSISFIYNLKEKTVGHNNLFRITNTYNNSGNQGDRICGMWVNPNDTSFYIEVETNTTNIGTNFSGVSLNTVALITLLFNDSVFTMYINNNYANSYIFNGRRPIPENATLYIGDPFYLGNGEINIQDFTLYDGILTPSQITTIYSESSDQGRQKMISDAKNAADKKAETDAKIAEDTAKAQETTYTTNTEITKKKQQKNQIDDQLAFFRDELMTHVYNNDIDAIKNDRIKIQQYQSLSNSLR